MKFYYSNNGITAYLMRDVRKKDPQGKCPLRWCVTYKRNRRYYSTGISLNLKDWELFEASEETDFNFKTKARHLKENKNDLDVYFENKLKPVVKEIADNFTFEALGNKLGKSDISNVNEAFQARINELYESDRINYAKSLKSIYSIQEKR